MGFKSDITWLGSIDETGRCIAPEQDNFITRIPFAAHCYG